MKQFRATYYGWIGSFILFWITTSPLTSYAEVFWTDSKTGQSFCASYTKADAGMGRRKLIVVKAVTVKIGPTSPSCAKLKEDKIRRISVNQFQNYLRFSFFQPEANWPGNLQSTIADFRQGPLYNYDLLTDRRKRIVSFYGSDSSSEVKEQIAAIDQRLSYRSEVEQAITDINQLADSLVDKVKDGDQFFLTSNTALQMIMQNYWNYPALPMVFVPIVVNPYFGRWSYDALDESASDFEIMVTEVTQHHLVSKLGAPFEQNASSTRSLAYCIDELVVKDAIPYCLNHPVDRISWLEADKFVDALNEGHDGYNYFLPSEIEWEYAARGIGRSTEYFFGDDVEQLKDYAWYEDDKGGSSGDHPHAVASTIGNNAFWLWDVSGNVWEWTRTINGALDRNLPSGGEVVSKETQMIAKGGSWGGGYGPRSMRSAARMPVAAESKTGVVGFRVGRKKI